MKLSSISKPDEATTPPDRVESHIYEAEGDLNAPKIGVYDRPEGLTKSKMPLYIIVALVAIALLAYLVM